MEHPREGDVESPTGAPAQVIDPRRGGDRNFDLYVTCLYWAITTISTVGFGDIHPNTPGEKIYTSVVMVTGRAGKGCEIPNFKGSYLGRFPLVLADFWTRDHLSERSRP